jgi:hypothetical protein
VKSPSQREGLGEGEIQQAPARFDFLSSLQSEEDPNPVPDALLAALGRELEATLQENFHYRYCRDLQQLDRLRVFRISSGGLEAYLARCQAQGQRAGAIKPVALHRLDGWLGAFQGRLLS